MKVKCHKNYILYKNTISYKVLIDENYISIYDYGEYFSFSPDRFSHSHNKQRLIHKIKFLEKEIKKRRCKIWKWKNVIP
jgi:hypothetical protein